MTHRPPRVLDASAMISYFEGNKRIALLHDYADNGLLNLLLPAAAIAEAQADIDKSFNGWSAGLLFCRGVRALELSEHCAIEVGTWPGSLGVRQTAHEARAMQAAAVTCDKSLYVDYPDLHIHVV